MSEEPRAPLPLVERSPSARYAVVLLFVVIGAVSVWFSWNDASASTGVLQHRMFLMGVALVWAVGAVTIALVPWWGQTRTWLIAAHLLIMGLYLGLAIATTNWTTLHIREWRQFWWAYPLLGGQIQQVFKLLRVPRNPQGRSPRLVRIPALDARTT